MTKTGLHKKREGKELKRRKLRRFMMQHGPGAYTIFRDAEKRKRLKRKKDLTHTSES